MEALFLLTFLPFREANLKNEHFCLSEREKSFQGGQARHNLKRTSGREVLGLKASWERRFLSAATRVHFCARYSSYAFLTLSGLV